MLLFATRKCFFLQGTVAETFRFYLLSAVAGLFHYMQMDMDQYFKSGSVHFSVDSCNERLVIGSDDVCGCMSSTFRLLFD